MPDYDEMDYHRDMRPPQAGEALGALAGGLGSPINAKMEAMRRAEMSAMQQGYAANKTSPAKDVPLSSRLAEGMAQHAAITEAILNTIMEAHHRHFGPASPFGEVPNGSRPPEMDTTEAQLLGEQRRQTERLATLGHLVQSLVARL